MILNNGQIFALYESLSELKQNENKLPIKIGFNIVRNIQILEPIYITIAEARREILLTYGEESGKDEVTIPQDKIEQANKEILELSQIENEVLLNTLNLSDLEFLSLALADIEKLFPIINGEA